MPNMGTISSAINVDTYKSDLTINAKHGHYLVSCQCQHGHKLVNYQCQTQAQSLQLSMSTRTQAIVNYQCQTWARSHQLSMSTWTLACKLSMPKTGMISSAINVNTNTSSSTINANHGHDLVSYQHQHGQKLVNYQRQTRTWYIINSFTNRGTITLSL